MTDLTPEELENVCYVVNIPYHKLDPREDMDEMLECLCHCMEKAEMRGKDLKYKELFDDLYLSISDAFYEAEAIYKEMFAEK